jgi:hypothetical protein
MHGPPTPYARRRALLVLGFLICLNLVAFAVRQYTG